MTPAIEAKWAALAAVPTPDGDDVQSHLGAPLGPHTAAPAQRGGAAVQWFARGAIVERADGRTFAVYGAIYEHYLRAGGPAGHLGAPTCDEEPAAHGGRVSRFQGGDLYWRADAGVREVLACLRALYAGGRDPFARSWTNRVVTRLASLRRRARLYTKR